MGSWAGMIAGVHYAGSGKRGAGDTLLFAVALAACGSKHAQGARSASPVSSPR